MSSRAAIIAQLGLDFQQWNADLAKAEKQAERAGGNISQKMSKGSERSGGMFKSERKVERSFEGLGMQMLSTSSAADLLAGSAEAMHKALRLPIGVAIGIGVAAKAYEALSEAVEKVKEANKGAREALSLSSSAIAGLGSEQAAQVSAGFDKQIEELRSSRGFKGVAGDFYAGLFGHGGQVAKSLSLEMALLDKKLEISARIAATAREESEGREIGAHVSERQGALLEAQAKTREKIAQLDLQAQKGELMPDAHKAMKEGAEAEGRLQAEAINRKADAAEREADLAKQLLAIKKAGKDVDSESAHERLLAAQRDLSSAQTVEQKSAAQNKVESAQQEYDQARKTTTERKQQIKDAISLSNTIADSDKKHLLALEQEAARLKAQAKTARPDEAAEIAQRVAENEAAQREAQKKIAANAFATRDLRLQSNGGDTDAEQLKTIDKRIKLKREELSTAKNLDESERAKLENETHGLDLQRQRVALEIMQKAFDESLNMAGVNAERERMNVGAKYASLQAEIEKRMKNIAELQKQGTQAAKDSAKAEQDKVTGLKAQQAALAQQASDRDKLSVDEMATGVGRSAGQARHALSDRNHARRAMLRGDTENAKKWNDRAEALINGNRGIKDSEKLQTIQAATIEVTTLNVGNQ